jgi:hypothetical protein
MVWHGVAREEDERVCVCVYVCVGPEGVQRGFGLVSEGMGEDVKELERRVWRRKWDRTGRWGLLSGNHIMLLNSYRRIKIT